MSHQSSYRSDSVEDGEISESPVDDKRDLFSTSGKKESLYIPRNTVLSARDSHRHSYGGDDRMDRGSYSSKAESSQLNSASSQYPPPPPPVQHTYSSVRADSQNTSIRPSGYLSASNGRSPRSWQGPTPPPPPPPPVLYTSHPVSNRNYLEVSSLSASSSTSNPSNWQPPPSSGHYHAAPSSRHNGDVTSSPSKTFNQPPPPTVDISKVPPPPSQEPVESALLAPPILIPDKPKSLITVVSDPSLDTNVGLKPTRELDKLHVHRPAPPSPSSSIVPLTPSSSVVISKPTSTHTIRTRPPSKSRSSSSLALSTPSDTNRNHPPDLLSALADGIRGGSTSDLDMTTLQNNTSTVPKSSGDNGGHSEEKGNEESGRDSSDDVGRVQLSSANGKSLDKGTTVEDAHVGGTGISNNISIILPPQKNDKVLNSSHGSSLVSSPHVDTSNNGTPCGFSSGGMKRPRLAWGQGLRTPTAGSSSAPPPGITRAVSEGHEKAKQNNTGGGMDITSTKSGENNSSCPTMQRSQSDILDLPHSSGTSSLPLETILSPRLVPDEGNDKIDHQLPDRNKSSDLSSDRTSSTMESNSCSPSPKITGEPPERSNVSTEISVYKMHNTLTTTTVDTIEVSTENKSDTHKDISVTSSDRVCETQPVVPSIPKEGYTSNKKASSKSGVQVKVKGKPGRPSLTDEEKAIKKAERKALKKQKKLLEEAAAAASKQWQGMTESALGNVESQGVNLPIASVINEGDAAPPKKKRGRPAGKTNSDSSKSPRKTGSSNDLKKSPRADKKDSSASSLSPRDQNHSPQRKSLKTGKVLNSAIDGSGELPEGEDNKKANRGIRGRKRGLDDNGDLLGDAPSGTQKQTKRRKAKAKDTPIDDAMYGGIPRIRRSRSELRQSASIGEIFSSLTDIRKSYFAVQNVLRLQVGISGLDQEGLDNLNRKISNPYSVVTLPIPPTSEIATCLDIVELHSNRLNDTLSELYEYKMDFQQRQAFSDHKDASWLSNENMKAAVSSSEATTGGDGGNISNAESALPIANGYDEKGSQSNVASSCRQGIGLSINIPNVVTGIGSNDAANKVASVHVSSPITILKKYRSNSSRKAPHSNIPLCDPPRTADSVVRNATKTRLQPLETYTSNLFLSSQDYSPFLQSNFAKIRQSSVIHVTSPVSAAVQDPRFTDHQLSFQKKDLERKRPAVMEEIRRRKIRTLQAWEILGDRFLNVKHHWKHHVEHCGPKEPEEQYVEKQGPRLRAVSVIASASSSNLSSLSGSANSQQSVGASGRFSSLRATSDLVRGDFDQEKVAQHQAMVALMKRRLEFGTTEVPGMISPWVQADHHSLPVSPLWPPAGLKVPEYIKQVSSVEKELSTEPTQLLQQTDVTIEKDADKKTPDVSSLLLPALPHPITESIGNQMTPYDPKKIGVIDNVINNGAEKRVVLDPKGVGGDEIKSEHLKEENSAVEPRPVDLQEKSLATVKQEGEIVSEGNLKEADHSDTVVTSNNDVLSFPKFVGSVPAIVDFNGCRLSLDGRRQRCSQVPLGVDCPPACNCAKQVDKLERLCRVWSDVEKCIFVDKFMQFPKNFHKIASFLVNRSTRDCVKFYYDSKAVIPFKSLLREFDNRKRSLKNNWSHTCQAALSVGGVIYSPLQQTSQQPDDKEPHCELPSETSFTAHANHPPYMAIAKGLENAGSYGEHREFQEDVLVKRPPRPLTDFLVARRHWKKVHDVQASSDIEKLQKGKKNTLIVGDSVFKSKVPPKWVYLNDTEYSLHSGSSNQKWSGPSAENVTQHYVVKTSNRTVTVKHSSALSPNPSSSDINNYLFVPSVSKKKKSKKEGASEQSCIFGGYGLGSEYLNFAPLPSAPPCVVGANINNDDIQSPLDEEETALRINWDEIYPIEYMGPHTKMHKSHPDRSRYPISKFITQRMATPTKFNGVSRRTSGGGNGRGKSKQAGNAKESPVRATNKDFDTELKKSSRRRRNILLPGSKKNVDEIDAGDHKAIDTEEKDTDAFFSEEGSIEVDFDSETRATVAQTVSTVVSQIEAREGKCKFQLLTASVGDNIEHHSPENFSRKRKFENGDGEGQPTTITRKEDEVQVDDNIADSFTERKVTVTKEMKEHDAGHNANDDTPSSSIDVVTEG